MAYDGRTRRIGGEADNRRICAVRSFGVFRIRISLKFLHEFLDLLVDLCSSIHFVLELLHR